MSDGSEITFTALSEPGNVLLSKIIDNSKLHKNWKKDYQGNLHNFISKR